MRSALLTRRFWVVPVFALALFTSITTAQAEMTKAEVEKIVQEYIANNAGLILESVQNYQDEQMRAQGKAAIQNNVTDLYFNEGTPAIGNPDGDITVVEFFDYNCGFCKKVLPTLTELLETDKNVRVLFKELPILGATSESATKWALAAHKQGKYFDYHSALMQNNKKITDALLLELAEQVGLDIHQAKRDVSGTEILLQIERNRALAQNMDIRGTPAFIIGEELIPGAVTLEQMQAVIADMRAKGATKE